MNDASKEKIKPQIKVKVLGQEGDEGSVTINTHAPCSQLLHKGLHEIYGEPVPSPDDYDLVFGGTVVEPLSTTVAEAGILKGSTVSILPKSISRG
jgi:hypothetical protein